MTTLIKYSIITYSTNRQTNTETQTSLGNRNDEK